MWRRLWWAAVFGGGGVEGLLVYMLDQNVKAWVLRQARAGVEAPVA